MFGRFLKSIISEWGSALSGIPSIPFAIAALYVTGTRQRLLYASLAMACGIYSSYRIWAKEYRRAEEFNQQLAQDKPQFSVKVDSVNWEYQKSADRTNIWFGITLSNRGAPSIARDWIAVLTQNGEDLRLTPLHIAADGARLAVDRLYIDYREEDLLSARALKAPIGRREQISGRLLFAIGGDRTQPLASGTVSFALGCQDFDGVCVGTLILSDQVNGAHQLHAYPGEQVHRYTDPVIEIWS